MTTSDPNEMSDQEIADLITRKAVRCGSCDHLPRWHQSGGCSFRVGEASPGVDGRCPCAVSGDGGQVTLGGGAL